MVCFGRLSYYYGIIVFTILVIFVCSKINQLLYRSIPFLKINVIGYLNIYSRDTRASSNHSRFKNHFLCSAHVHFNGF